MTQRGFYRRRIIVLVQECSVYAGIEDDFHHFRVQLDHDGKVVTGITGEAERFPWVTCPGATPMLGLLVGTPLRPDAMRHADAFDRFHQCTHQLELALLAIAAAARGNSRYYDVAIGDPDENNLQRATVDEGESIVEDWAIRAGEIIAPAELAGQEVRALRSWVDTLDDQRYDRIAILRRCLQVGSGRQRKIRPDIASGIVGARNACYAFQDERAAFGQFIPESVRDHSDVSHRLLDEFR